MTYRIVTVKPRNPNVRHDGRDMAGMRLRVMNENHVDTQGRKALLVQKETADNPMGGLFSITADMVI